MSRLTITVKPNQDDMDAAIAKCSEMLACLTRAKELSEEIGKLEIGIEFSPAGR